MKVPTQPNTPDTRQGTAMGFRNVASDPMVRSYYHADQMLPREEDSG